jgi:hypothetical protein
VKNGLKVYSIHFFIFYYALLLPLYGCLTFFLIVATAYIPVAIWILKAKYGNKIPYTLALIWSGALIIFYILTRTINIGYIGLQTDVGTIDVITKVLQGIVIFLSVYIMKPAKQAIYAR